jgi:hypothetical protein
MLNWLAVVVVYCGLIGTLFGVSPASPLTSAAVLVIVAVTTCAALIVPARGALSVDSLTALRAE